MIDLPPKPTIWLPPKPAIIRFARDIKPPELGMLPGISPVIAAGQRDVFVTNFSEYATGALPSDWTKRWVGTNYTASVEGSAGSLAGKAMKIVVTTTGVPGLLSWDKVPLAADFELLARARLLVTPTGTNGYNRLAGRGSGTGSSGNAYIAASFNHGSSSTNWRVQLNKLAAGTSSILNGPQDGLGPTMSNTPPSVWVWQRFRVQGTSIARKTWQQGVTEPASFQVTISDSSITAAGWVGLSIGDSVVNTYEFDFFSVALKGKTAPA